MVLKRLAPHPPPAKKAKRLVRAEVSPPKLFTVFWTGSLFIIKSTVFPLPYPSPLLLFILWFVTVRKTLGAFLSGYRCVRMHATGLFIKRMT